MHYIVFDLEWNSAGRANRVDQAIQDIIPFEIIEIGAVKLDEAFQTIARFSTQIRPRIYPILTGPVAAVTRRHQQSMKYGLNFQDAARDFFDFCGDDYIFCTWSESDTATLLMNLRYYEIAEQLDALCLDVQFLFDHVVEQADTQRSIEYAIDFLNLKKNQPFHQAVNDAWYTGQILREIVLNNQQEAEVADLINRYAFDPNLNRSSQIRLSDLPDLPAIQAELGIQSLVCPACSIQLQQIQAWQLDKNRLTALFYCEIHGKVTAKCRFRRKPQQRYSAHVMIRLDRDQAQDALYPQEARLPDQAAGDQDEVYVT
ncbi:MAG: exonuclease domain-containing protein [Ruminococcaceae bacterium]|nr:exonuclease domain-containing protein [Oscillospiraceae bacterium]